ncbi:MAG: methionine--tRNA ligase [Bacillota bacterium]
MPTASKGTFYITTPIYYPSDSLHIGHAYTTVAADAIARFKRLQGYDTRFLTGTDEHGQKIERKAQAAGKTPQEFVDGIVVGIKRLWERLGISYDDFIRTTEARHKNAVQEIFRRIQDKGDIYKSEYEGWYCVPCETFWLERQLVDGKCPNPDCGRPVELLKEESYFFRLSRYQDRLLKHIEGNPDFIQPASRRNEMIRFIKGGLEDLCVSRTTFKWGIPVPGDQKHVIYVWFDALANYLTALGYPLESEVPKYWPADVHLMAKEIVRFHTVIWPIILMALDVPLPKRVFGHGWLVFEGGKMSKSKGNVIDPLVLIEKYGVDAVRYFLLREIPFGADGFYSEDNLIQRVNTDLANDLGNLLNRSLVLLEKNFGNVVPTSGPDDGFAALVVEVIKDFQEAMERLELSNALAAVWRLVARGNKYLDEEAPWALAKQGRKDRAGEVIYNVLEVLRISATLLTPFMMETPERIWLQLGVQGSPRDSSWETLGRWGLLQPGTPVAKGEPLFPRIEVSSDEENQYSTISIEEFQRLDLRVARVLSAERVKGTDKLLKIDLDLGYERRQVVSGIAEDYSPEDLAGRFVIIVANLEEAKIRGVRSKGMILAACDGKGDKLLTVDRPTELGSKVL